MAKGCERLFFALWPDDPVREQIGAAYRSLPVEFRAGRLMRSSNLHVTLHFLGNVPVEQVACFERQAGAIRAQPFSLVFDRAGEFSRARVGWLGCTEIPPGLQLLHRELGLNIQRCGFEIDKRAYNPHMTLVRKLSRRVRATGIAPIVWRIERFVLVRSIAIEGGVEYRVKASYPLDSNGDVDDEQETVLNSGQPRGVTRHCR